MVPPRRVTHDLTLLRGGICGIMHHGDVERFGWRYRIWRNRFWVWLGRDDVHYHKLSGGGRVDQIESVVRCGQEHGLGGGAVR